MCPSCFHSWGVFPPRPQGGRGPSTRSALRSHWPRVMPVLFVNPRLRIFSHRFLEKVEGKGRDTERQVDVRDALVGCLPLLPQPGPGWSLQAPSGQGPCTWAEPNLRPFGRSPNRAGLGLLFFIPSKACARNPIAGKFQVSARPEVVSTDHLPRTAQPSFARWLRTGPTVPPDSAPGPSERPRGLLKE